MVCNGDAMQPKLDCMVDQSFKFMANINEVSVGIFCVSMMLVKRRRKNEAYLLYGVSSSSGNSSS